MRTGNVREKQGARSGTIERLLQSYVIASVVSTSGVDVLLVLTLLLLVLISLRPLLTFLGLPWRLPAVTPN